MRMMKITLHVSEDRVSTIYDVVTGYCECVSITPVVEHPKKKNRRYVNGAHDKGISGRDLVLQIAAHGPVSYEEIKRAFKNSGFARTSASPAISTLRAEGKISVVGHIVTLESERATRPAGMS
jgi:hypothetical protein